MLIYLAEGNMELLVAPDVCLGPIGSYIYDPVYEIGPIKTILPVLTLTVCVHSVYIY